MPSKEEATNTLREAAAKETGGKVTVDKEVLEAAIGKPSQPAIDRAYSYLVPGLILLTLLALVGMFWLIADGNTATAPDLLLTAFTASLTGLLGLFVRAPGS